MAQLLLWSEGMLRHACSFAAIAFVALLGCPYSCNALVGETYAQVTARYGQPVDSVIGEQRYLYRSNGLSIFVTFVNKISQSEIYSPVNETHKFTTEEAAMILGANTDGKIGFTRQKVGGLLSDFFYSDDGKLYALIVSAGPQAGRLITVSSLK